MLWPEMDAALMTSGGGGNPPAAVRRPVVSVQAGLKSILQGEPLQDALHHSGPITTIIMELLESAC
jgi:hypothetical protein